MSATPSSIKAMLPWFALALIVFAIDFFTKSIVLSNFYYGERLAITSFFNLVLVYNYGAAFSFLATSGGWQVLLFSAIAVVAVGVCSYLIYKHTHETLFCLALALIMGGAIGNLFDRIIYGYVIDFLDFHYQHWHWPAFNVADMAIVGGAGLMILESFMKPAHDKE
ncbi:MAG: lipoprotein signal peptidase [Burkholderiaceae bacterium]|nr:lipoprotein signal peptidase [Burkholderiaceae bacterium]